MGKNTTDQKGYDRIDPDSVEGFNEIVPEYEYNEKTGDFEETECPEKGGFIRRNNYHDRN